MRVQRMGISGAERGFGAANGDRRRGESTAQVVVDLIFTLWSGRSDAALDLK
jgi:hypothetical protein